MKRFCGAFFRNSTVKSMFYFCQDDIFSDEKIMANAGQCWMVLAFVTN